MSSCEMCGKETEDLVNAVVEGTILKVCKDCASYGNVVELKPKQTEEEIHKPQEIEVTEPEFLIIENYAEKIKKARERRSLKQEDLAKAIAEKESVIQRLETGQISPNLTLAKKLEQFLQIKLVEQSTIKKKKIKKLDFRDTSITIGDLLHMKK